jgi:hypothetical protein
LLQGNQALIFGLCRAGVIRQCSGYVFPLCFPSVRQFLESPTEFCRRSPLWLRPVTEFSNVGLREPGRTAARGNDQPARVRPRPSGLQVIPDCPRLMSGRRCGDSSWKPCSPRLCSGAHGIAAPTVWESLRYHAKTGTDQPIDPIGPGYATSSSFPVSTS